MAQARSSPRGRGTTGPSLLSRPRLAAVAAAAAILALALVAASLLGARGEGGAPGGVATGAAVFGASEVEQLLAGIPQEGGVLGEPDAPVTLVEYADLQCPYCAQWAVGAFRELVSDYVRAGQLRIEFRGLAFLGPDSERALRPALAAGEQDRLWHVVELLYMNQGGESSGWVSDELLAGIGRSVPGLDGERMLADADSSSVTAAMERAAAQAQEAGVQGTPFFEVGRTGGTLAPLELTSLGAEEFRAAIDRLLGG